MHDNPAPAIAAPPVPSVLDVLGDLAEAGMSDDATVAFEVVRRQVDARLRRYLMHAFGDRGDDHQDWLHDFYVALPRRARSFRRGSWNDFVAWCVRVIKNDALKQLELEERRGESSFDDLLEEGESSPSAAAAITDLGDDLEASGEQDAQDRETRRNAAIKWVLDAMSGFSEEQRRMLAIVLSGGTVAAAARALALTPKQAAKLRENALKRFMRVKKPKIERFL